MALQIDGLETSFQSIAPRGEAFVTTFSERLFTYYPRVNSYSYKKEEHHHELPTTIAES